MIVARAIKYIENIDFDKDILFHVTFKHEPKEFDDNDFGKRVYSIIVKGAKANYDKESFSSLLLEIKDEISDHSNLKFSDHYERHDFDTKDVVYVHGYECFDLKRKTLEADNWAVWKSLIEDKTNLEVIDLETQGMDIVTVEEMMHGKKDHVVNNLKKSTVSV